MNPVSYPSVFEVHVWWYACSCVSREWECPIYVVELEICVVCRIIEARQKKIQSRKVDIDELTALADSAVKSGTPRVADSEQRGSRGLNEMPIYCHPF